MSRFELTLDLEKIQENLNDSNTDGSYNVVDLSSFLSP